MDRCAKCGVQIDGGIYCLECRAKTLDDMCDEVPMDPTWVRIISAFMSWLEEWSEVLAYGACAAGICVGALALADGLKGYLPR